MRSHAKYLLLALAGFAFACSGDDGADTTPVIQSFTISKADVSAGEKVTLTWAATGVTDIAIHSSEDPATPFYEGTMASGSTESPGVFDTVTFTLYAKNSVSGLEVEQTVSINSVGGLQIASFTATPMMAEEDQEVTLAWRIGGDAPTEVVIKDADGAEVFRDDSPESESSVDILPVPDENNEATYRLQVRGPGQSRDEASVTVTVNVIIDQPEIVDFFAASTDVAKGSRAQLTWEVANTVEVQVSLNGSVVRPYTDVGVPNGNTRLTITEDTNVFTLEAKSEDDVVVTEEITVRGLDVPVIENLTVSPTSYTTGSTVATVTWETTFADSVNLQLNGRDVPNFPRDQTNGTYQVNVVGAATLTFIATNPIQDTTRDVMIELGYEDAEPNDSFAQAIPIPADGLPVRGTVTMPGDVDWYTFIVPQGSFLYVQAGMDDNLGCVFDTIVRLYDADGTTELGFEDNTTAPNISPCAEINPLVSDYAARLPAGTYYVSVGGSGVMNIGQYNLIVRLVTPVPMLGGMMTPLRIGNPSWDIGDFVQYSAPLDGMATVPWSVGIDPFFAPMTSAAAGNGIGVLVDSDVPHTPDYDTELRMALDMRGKASGTTFPVAEIIEPLGMYVGFTIYPAATSTTTGESPDFASGAIIPRSTFPLSVELDFEVNGMIIPDLATMYNIVYAGGGTTDGASHQHVFAAVRAGAGANPADLLGDYNWDYTILDSTMSGYTFKVPFTLQ